MKTDFLILGLAIGCGVLTCYATSSYIHNQQLQRQERYQNGQIALVDLLDPQYSTLIAGGAGAIAGLLLGIGIARRTERATKVKNDS